jgi:hypothetical protein
MQIMLENSFNPVKPGSKADYTIKKKKLVPVDNSSTLEQSEMYETKKNSSINGKRTSQNQLNGKN